MIKISSLLLLLAMAAGEVFAQETPDFSETWKLTKSFLEDNQRDLGLLLDQKAYLDRDKIELVKSKSKFLTNFEKDLFYDKYQLSPLWAYPNIYFGVASWVEGDYTSAIIIDSGWVLTIGSLVANVDPNGGLRSPYLLGLTAVLELGTIVYSVVAHINFSNDRNQQLRQALNGL
jgi:hypothetical protein